MEDATILFDKGLCGAVEGIVVGGGHFFGHLQWMIVSLPVKVGVLGLYSSVEATSCFYDFQSPVLGVARLYIERQWSTWYEL
jgi:hypothetical protein